MQAQALQGLGVRPPRLALLAHRATPTNHALVAAWRASGLEAGLMSPREALACLHAGDLALGRLDVRPSFDGVEDGLWHLRRLERAGVRVINRAPALLAAHDKLATARALERAALPHPETAHVEADRPTSPLSPPVVLKPRFGSWGGDVVLCETRRALRRNLARLGARGWFGKHGVLVQEFVPPQLHDLRVVVAGGHVVGAVRRVRAPGEWRTNISLGASRVPVEPSARACALALAAMAALGLDLAGVDLLPTASGDYVVLEINGAVDFTRSYLRAADIFQVAATALLAGRGRIQALA